MSGAFAGTSYVDQAQLEEWFAGAAAGAQAIYATGPSGVPSHPVQKLVNEWERTGEIVKLPNVRLGPNMWRYALVRARPQSRAAADQRGRKARVSADEDWRETEAGRIYMTLVRAANLGLPCPTNAQLAEVAGIKDADAARYQVRLLRDQGRIEVLLSGAGRSFRRVRITETGRWTADEPGSAPIPGILVPGQAMKGEAA
jgi:hypothetical protein